MALNPNITTSSGLSVGMQSYYDRVMLTTATPILVHAQFAEQKQIPKNSGKIVQWRRWTPLPVLTTALSESVVPDGQYLTEEQVTATVYPYGGYATRGALYDLTHLDANLQREVELLAQQGAESIDAIVRDVMATTDTTQYANSKTAIYDIATTDKLDTTEIRKMVRTLKQNKAKPYMINGRPHFIAIVGPDTEYDLQDDTKWVNVATYQDKEKIYSGEIGKLFGVKFVYTNAEKKYENEELVDGQVYLTVASVATGGVTVTVDEAISAAEATGLTGRYVNLYDVSNTTTPTYVRRQITAAASGAAGAATITLTASAGDFTLGDGDYVYANEYGKTGNDVFATFVFGQEAYAMADIAGSGRMYTIVKPKDSGGVSNPLNQFGTIGWKVDAMACEILQDLWIGKILHGASE